MRLFCYKLIIMFFSICLPQHTIAQFKNNHFPYQLNKNDRYLLPAGIVLFATGEALSYYSKTISIDEISQLNPDNINRFDRPAIHYFSEKHNKISDYSRAALVLSPSLLMLHQARDLKLKNSITLGFIYLESMLFLKGINDAVKNLTSRPRPFLFNTNLSEKERFDYLESTSSYGSFFSGHASTAFLSAIFLSKTFTDIYGKSKWSNLVWASSLSAATITAYCRVASGEHFPTDVITGALIGSAFGYLFPVLHKKNNPDLNITLTATHIQVKYFFK